MCAVTKTGRRTVVAPSDKAVEQLLKGAAQFARLASAVLPNLMRQSRHKSNQMALAYLRPTDLWRNNVTESVFGTKKNGDG